jgi:hypothetical protein
MGFVVDKATLGQVLSEYFVSPAKYSSDYSTIIIIIIINGWYNNSPVAASAIVNSVPLHAEKETEQY